jgi:hypothetical protein
MGLDGTYQEFREFLRAEGCEAQFDLAFLRHNGHTALDAALWEASDAEHIIAHAFCWSATPEGRNFWQQIDHKWQIHATSISSTDY